MKVSLFFDAETSNMFGRNIPTPHRRAWARVPRARQLQYMGTGSTAAAGTDTGNQTLNRYKLIEEFSDFNRGPLTLPAHLQLRLTVDAQRTLLLEWVMISNNSPSMTNRRRRFQCRNYQVKSLVMHKTSGQVCFVACP